jgi:hypothetical protein
MNMIFFNIFSSQKWGCKAPPPRPLPRQVGQKILMNIPDPEDIFFNKANLIEHAHILQK